MARTIQRIINCLQVICNSYHRLHEHAQIGDGVVTYYGKRFANYEFLGDTDVPHFQFSTLWDDKAHEFNKTFERRQFLLQPYIDNILVRDNINYAVQEIRKTLLFDEALAIRHVRDVLDGDWNNVTVKTHTENKIIRGILRHLNVDTQQARQMMKHIAMCCVYEI